MLKNKLNLITAKFWFIVVHFSFYNSVKSETYTAKQWFDSYHTFWFWLLRMHLVNSAYHVWIRNERNTVSYLLYMIKCEVWSNSFMKNVRRFMILHVMVHRLSSIKLGEILNTHSSEIWVKNVSNFLLNYLCQSYLVACM